MRLSAIIAISMGMFINGVQTGFIGSIFQESMEENIAKEDLDLNMEIMDLAMKEVLVGNLMDMKKVHYKDRMEDSKAMGDLD